jgi:hypothetical protein
MRSTYQPPPENTVSPEYKQLLKAAAKRKSKILSLHAKGESRNSIASKAQCSPQYVNRVIKKAAENATA